MATSSSGIRKPRSSPARYRRSTRRSRSPTASCAAGDLPRSATPHQALHDMRPAISERKLVFLVGTARFIATLDFAMVLPLGPDFAQALGIPVSKLGIVGGSYIATEMVAAIAGAFFLDRFDRRRALAVALI